MQKKEKVMLAALSGVPFVMVLGNSMLIPVLPAIKNDLNLTQFQVSLVITLFSVPAGIIIPLAGFLSDRIGRKKVIVPSLILYGLGGTIAGLAAFFLGAKSFPLVLGGRIAQGTGAAGTAPIAMALVGDLFIGKERSKSLGIIESANGSGKVISPVLGAAVGLIAWYATLFVFPVLTVPIAAAIWFLVKEPDLKNPPPGIGEYFSSIKNILAQKSAVLLSSFLSGMVALLILFGVLFFLSDFLETALHLEGIIKGLALAVPVLFMSTTSYVTGLFIKKNIRLMKSLVVAGLTMIAVSLLAMEFFKGTFPFFIAISLAGIGTGLVLPPINTIITSTTGREKRGMITSIYGSVRFLGVAAGPPIFSILMNYGSFWMFVTAAAMGATAAFTAALFIRPERIQENKKSHDRPSPANLDNFAFETGSASNIAEKSRPRKNKRNPRQQS